MLEPLSEFEVRTWLPARSDDAHKGSVGKVLIIAGCDAMPGAAVLAARGALRMGAGLVTVASTALVCQAVVASLPEATTFPLLTEDGRISPDSVSQIEPIANGYQSAIIGPGLSATPQTGRFLQSLLSKWQVPTVLDADALTLIASLGLELQGNFSLTPHPGEMERLIGTSEQSREKQVDQAVQKFSQPVLLKGKGTLIGAPGKPTRLNPTGNSGMATGGMGDVLSGIIASLIAQGVPTYEAMCAGAYVHGAAGDWCAKHIGPRGYLASELADAVPAVLA